MIVLIALAVQVVKATSFWAEESSGIFIADTIPHEYGFFIDF